MEELPPWSKYRKEIYFDLPLFPFPDEHNVPGAQYKSYIMATQLTVVLATTLLLLDQFSASLSIQPNDASPAVIREATSDHAQAQAPTSTTNGSPNHQSALPLLRIGATTMKAVVTKLSLLTITPPFTASAISTMLRQLNDSILPSLVSGALSLESSPQSTRLFAKEAHFLVRRALEDLKPLAQSIRLQMTSNSPDQPSPSHHSIEIGTDEKNAVLEATAKIFEDCDALQRFAEGGLMTFIVKKAELWLELMKDAVKELEDWDPEDDEDEDDELLEALSGLTFTNGSQTGFESNQTSSTSTQTPSIADQPFSVSARSQPPVNNRTTAIKSGVKAELLRVLTRIPRTIRAVITHRLLKLPSDDLISLSPTQRQTLTTILDQTRTISECIDESAEGMYMGDAERALRKAGEARQLCIEVVEGVVGTGWGRDGDGGGDEEGRTGTETKEDRYMVKALVYIRQVHSTEPT